MSMPTSWKAPLWIIAITVVGLLLVACAAPATPAPATQAPAAAAPTQPPAEPTKAPEPTAPPAPTTAPEAKLKVVTFSFVQEPDSLSPLYSTMWYSWLTRGFWMTPLVMFDEAAQPIPEIAKDIPSVENGGLTADGMTITYTLRSEAVWSDGTPVTADDFVFTFDMITSDKNTAITRAPYDTHVDKVEAVSTDTLVIRMKKPYPGWLPGLFNYVLPKHILEPVFQKEGTLDNAEWNRAPTVGHGPFVFKEWQSGNTMLFEANPNYWRGRPKLDQIYLRFVPDDAAQLAGLKSGDVDFGVWFAYSDVPDLEKSGVRIQMAQSGYQEVWFLNVDPKTAHPALLDEKVRMAVLMGVDREKITKELLYGLTQPMKSFWDGSPYGDDPDLTFIPYDPEGAKKLLDEAGWKVGADGTREKDGKQLVLRFVTTTREVRKNVQVIVQQELAELGIKVELVNFPGDVFFNGYAAKGPIATGQYDIVEWSANPRGWPDPDVSDYFLCAEVPSDEKPSGQNWQGLCDKELDALLTEQASTLDVAKRIDLFHQIAKLLRDKAYFVSMWNDPDLWGINKRVVNTEFSGAIPFFYNITEWDIAE